MTSRVGRAASDRHAHANRPGSPIFAAGSAFLVSDAAVDVNGADPTGRD